MILWLFLVIASLEELTMFHLFEKLVNILLNVNE